MNLNLSLNFRMSNVVFQFLLIEIIFTSKFLLVNFKTNINKL